MKLTARVRNLLANSSISLSIASGGIALVVYNTYPPRIEFMVLPFLASVIAALLAILVIAYCLFAKQAMSVKAILALILAIASYAIGNYVVEDYLFGLFLWRSPTVG